MRSLPFLFFFVEWETVKGKIRKMNWETSEASQARKLYGKSQLEIEGREINSLKYMRVHGGQEKIVGPWVIILHSEYHCSSIHKVLSGFFYANNSKMGATLSSRYRGCKRE